MVYSDVGCAEYDGDAEPGVAEVQNLKRGHVIVASVDPKASPPSR